jgi:hypothetical protein
VTERTELNDRYVRSIWECKSCAALVDGETYIYPAPGVNRNSIKKGENIFVHSVFRKRTRYLVLDLCMSLVVERHDYVAKRTKFSNTSSTSLSSERTHLVLVFKPHLKILNSITLHISSLPCLCSLTLAFPAFKTSDAGCGAV